MMSFAEYDVARFEMADRERAAARFRLGRIARRQRTRTKEQ
jgi:hypothetical protein